MRDYVEKNGFPGVLLGLSGGIDSALTLAVAVDALGAERVRAVMMPSQYTAQMSRDDAHAEAQALGVRYDEIAIQPMFDAYLAALADEFKGLPADTTEENLQSRIRGTLLMALSNKSGAIVLTTGNKSEMGTGYATLYGDMAGGFSVLKDIDKMLVYRLARYRNSISPVIPAARDRPGAVGRVETRPDRPGQPAAVSGARRDTRGVRRRRYEPRGHHLARFFEDRRRARRAARAWSEYKRRQAPIGVRITSRGFGKDWRYPVTNRFRHRFD